MRPASGVFARAGIRASGFRCCANNMEKRLAALAEISSEMGKAVA
jgi:hypothetical protein